MSNGNNGQITGAISAALTLYFTSGNTTAASWAYTIGAGVGTALLDKIEGPRLSDTRVQISSYGATIPRHWGGTATMGNIVWTTDLVASEDTAGKGGPAQVNTTYSASWAVVFGRGVVPGFRRIWLGSKLVCDLSGAADSGGQVASMKFLNDHVTWHTGAEDQMPDATIESYEGAGNVEAMRGCAYMVFRNVPLGDYGNQIPIARVELTTQEVVTISTTELAPYIIGSWAGDPPQHRLGMNPATTNYSYSGPSGTISTTDWEAAVAALLVDHPQAVHRISYITSIDGYTLSSGSGYSSLGATQQLNSPGGGSDNVYNYFGPDEVTDVIMVSTGANVAATIAAYGATCDDDRVYVIENAGFQYTGYLFKIYGVSRGSPVGNYTVWNPATGVASVGTGAPYLYRYAMPNIGATRVPSIPGVLCYPGDPMTNEIVQVPGNPDLCMTAFGEYSINTGFSQIVGGSYDAFRQLQVWAHDGVQVTKKGLGPIVPKSDPRWGDSAFWTAEAAAAGIGGTFEASGGGGGNTWPVNVSIAGQGSYGLTTVGPGSVTLASIVTDICAEAGLPSGKIDVTALTDTVSGYSVGRITSARQALEPLRQAFLFDAVERDGKIVFVKRGGAPVATIPLDSLGAGQDEAKDPMGHERAQEAELPAELSVSYPCREADYETGTQTAKRVTTGSQQQVTVELPLVMTDAQAAAVADVQLRQAWTARTSRTFSTTRAWSKYEPTDVVTVTDGQFSYRVRLMERTENGPVIDWVAVDESGAYTSNAVAGETSGGGATVTFDGPTKLEVLDVPILRDADDAPGYYLAASGYGPGWRGGRAYRSTDGANYTALAELNRAATQGFAESVLPAWSGGNTVDEASAVLVTLHDGTLSSITHAQLLDGGNAALLGNELIQFRSATLVSGKQYRLSGFLRGRRGTEQHMGAHANKERFVLLEAAGLYRIGSSVSQIGVASTLKAVTYGMTLEDSAAKAFTDSGAGLKPLSPVHLSAMRQPDGSYQCKWDRRTRIGGDWRNNSDASLGETSEQYRVRVLDGATVVDTQTVTANYAVIGSAAASYTITQVASLSTAVTCLSAVSGSTDLVGLWVDERNSYPPQKIVRVNAAGVRQAISPDLGQYITQVAHGASDVYVAAERRTTSGTPIFTLDSTVYRLSHADVTTVAASKVISTASPVWSGVAVGGGYVWLARGTDQQILKCDASTLATVSTYTYTGDNMGPLHYAGSELWCGTTGGDLLRINPATGAIAHRYTLGLGFAGATNVFVVGSIAFVVAMGKVFTINTSTHATIATITVGTTGMASREAAIFGSYLIVSDYPSVCVISTSTGLELGRPLSSPLPIAYVSGAGSSLYASPSAPLGGTTSAQITVSAPTVAVDLSGKTLEVCQVSDLVGPGFPSTITL